MNFICVPFNQLSSLDVYKVLQLRSEIFVVEQACIYQDIDGKDTHAETHHVMLHSNDKLIAYARLLPKGLSYESPSIGRILISQSARGENLGRKLVSHCIEQTLALWPNCQITIGAQSHLSRFYQAFGFSEMSEHYLEDGIQHVDMIL